MITFGSMRDQFIRGWNQFWFAELDPISVGVFRVCLGLLIAADCVSLYPHWQRDFSANGMLSLSTVDPAGLSQDRVTLFYWTEGWLPVEVWFWVGLAAAIGLALGFRTRIMTIVTYLMQVSMVHRNNIPLNTENKLFCVFLFFGLFAPLGEELSVDAILRGGQNKRSRSTVWPVRLIQLHTCLIYVISLPHKLATDPAWLGGTAVYWAMTGEMWSRFPWPEFFYHKPIAAISTYGSLLVEGSFPVLVWFRNTKLPVLLAITLFHIGIGLMMQDVMFFSLAMACSFLLFVPPETVRKVIGLLSVVRQTS